jgi:Arc/MetJ-type ribon-helix-helix transcriptional regulator
VRSALRLLQEQEERRVAFIASLQAATAEAEHDGFVPASVVEADVLQAISTAAQRRKV